MRGAAGLRGSPRAQAKGGLGVEGPPRIAEPVDLNVHRAAFMAH